MLRRWFHTSRFSYLTTLLCCALALLAGNEPTNPFHLTVLQLVDETKSESEQTQDEESEASKVSESTLAARRSFRKKRVYPAGHSKTVMLSLQLTCCSPSSFSDAVVSPNSERTRLNGVGAPLRC